MNPTDITVHQKSRTFDIAFDDGSSFSLPFEYMRVYSPSAEVRGHGAGQEVLQVGKRDVGIESVAPVGNYAIQPNWADGQGTPLSQYALQPSDAQPFDPMRLPRSHTVGANETLFDIATRYQAPVRALIEQNGLEPPYTVAPGRVLELPPPRLHTSTRQSSRLASSRISSMLFFVLMFRCVAT